MRVRPWDPVGAFRVLEAHDVDYIVIGGLAGTLLGSTSVTDDTDICYGRDDDNLERLAAALREMKARLRGVQEEVPFLLEAKTLRAGQNFTFATEYGSLDCLGKPAGVEGYEELIANVVWKNAHGLRVPVCSLQDLMVMKRAAGRPVDLRELEILGALEEEITGQERRRREGNVDDPAGDRADG
jgi:hypothetical protein